MGVLLAIAAAAGACIMFFNNLLRRSPVEAEGFLEGVEQTVNVVGSWITLVSDLVDAFRGVRRSNRRNMNARHRAALEAEYDEYE